MRAKKKKITHLGEVQAVSMQLARLVFVQIKIKFCWFYYRGNKYLNTLKYKWPPTFKAGGNVRYHGNLFLDLKPHCICQPYIRLYNEHLKLIKIS